MTALIHRHESENGPLETRFASLRQAGRRSTNMLCACMLTLLLLDPIARPSARAQEPPVDSLFQQLFPQPTGQNGYEEVVAAGEMLKRSALLLSGEQAGLKTLTLSQKRALLADPPIQEAMTLLRHGLAKSLHTPHENPQESGFKAFGLYRQIARVLALEQYVLCADGHVGQAIDSLRDALRLGYAIQSGTLIGGLVGVAMDSLVISAMRRHLDQLSDNDCRRLIRLARAWRDAPDPAIEAVGAESEQVLKTVESQLPVDATFPRDRVLAGMRARLDHYAANLRKPLWERKPVPPLQGERIVADYVNNLGQTLDPLFEQTQTAFVKDQAAMEVLGVHAAIRRYRWQHDSLPVDLDALKLGPLATDPFTGKPLTYHITGSATYELTSEGLKPRPVGT